MKLWDDRVYHSSVAGILSGIIREGDRISLIIIDGYNLIGISHSNLGAERDRLVRALSEYRKEKGHVITVVFDGWKSGGRFPESQVTGGIRVIYTRLGDTADAVIKAIVGSEKKEWIVVTSDRDIAAFAWSSGSVPVQSETFRRVLEHAGGPVAGNGGLYNDDAEEGPARKKGKPTTPSRKEKALVRVLKKL